MDKKIRAILTAIIFLNLLLISYAKEELFLHQKGFSSLKVTITRDVQLNGNIKNGEITIKTIAFRDAPGQKVIQQNAYAVFDGKTYDAEFQKDLYNNNLAIFTIKGINLQNKTKILTYTIEATVDTNFIFLPKKLYLEKEKFSEFTQPTKYIDSNNQSITTLVQNFFTENDFNVVIKILNWINSYLTYDWNYAKKAYKASEVLATKAGTCDEFSNLAAALLRAKNIPVKFVEGIVYGDKGWQQHAWLLFYANDWYYAEPTFFQLLNLDSLHIVQGIFKDFEESHDSFSYTKGIEISPKEAKLDIKILNINDFPKFLNFSQEEAKLFANTPGSIKLKIENLTNSFLCFPATISTSEKIRIFNNSAFLDCIKPKSYKEKEIQLVAAAEVEKNTYLQYKLYIQTLNNASLRFNLYPATSEGKTTGKFLQIKSISAYKKENKNIIDVIIENFSSELLPIKFYFDDSLVNKEVAPNSKHTFSFTLPLNIKKINFRIVAEDLNYSQILYFPEIEAKKRTKPKVEEEKPEIQQETKIAEQVKQFYDILFLIAAFLASIIAIIILIVLFKKFKSK